MHELYLFVCATLGLDAVLLGFLAWAYYSPRFAAYRISESAPMRVPWKHRLRTMTETSALSLVVVLGGLYVFRSFLIDERPAAAWLIALQAAGILLVYDFAYYFAHRAMHHPKLLRRVHGVHHRARNPSALESFYQHPLELMAGLFLFFASTALVGPVSPYAFAAAFFLYSTLNILVHSGLESHSRLLAPIDFLTRKHHAHHRTDPQRNYSTMTLLPDLLFRTTA